MAHFLIRYAPPRESFVDDATPEEAAVIENHFEYLKRLLAEGNLIMAGRTERGEIGIAVIEVDNNDKANKIMADDPAVRAGIFTGQLYPFRLALIKN